MSGEKKGKPAPVPVSEKLASKCAELKATLTKVSSNPKTQRESKRKQLELLGDLKPLLCKERAGLSKEQRSGIHQLLISTVENTQGPPVRKILAQCLLAIDMESTQELFSALDAAEAMLTRSKHISVKL